MDEIKYQKKDLSYPANPVLDKLNREAMQNQLTSPGVNYSLDENRVAYANLAIFFLILVLVILALSGYGWAAYAFVFILYTIFINSLIKKKILLSKNARFPSVGQLVVVGARAVFLSALLLTVLTIILLLIHINIMELILVPGALFSYRINFVSVVIGLPIGVIVGLLNIKFTNYWEKIALQKYNSEITGI